MATQESYDCEELMGACLAASNCSNSEAISRHIPARSRYIVRISTSPGRRAASSHSLAFLRHAFTRSLISWSMMSGGERSPLSVNSFSGFGFNSFQLPKPFRSRC
jgi:hypothetical protein